MNSWLVQLLVGSLGLSLAALLAGLWLRLWRRDPLASYRMAVIVLIVTLCMPLAQWSAKRGVLPDQLGPMGQWVRASFGHLAPELGASEVQLHPVPSTNSGFASIALLDHSAIHGIGALTELQRLQLENDRTGYQIAELHAEQQLLESRLRPSSASLEPWHERQLVGNMNAAELVLYLYLVGLASALLHTSLRLWRTKRLLSSARPVIDPDSLAMWRALIRKSPVASRVRLLESEQIRVPMCFGLGTPVVVLPLGGRGDLDADLFSCVLLHELVHLERRDTWVMLGQEFARSIFWFHPAAWWLCNRIDLLRELSCDLLVVRRTGRRKRYATALVEYAARMRDELRPSQAQATALLPWSSSTHQLSRRIEMLVKLSASKPGGSRRSMFLAAGSLFGVLWGGQLATAAAMAPAQQGEPEVVDIIELLDAIESEEPEFVRRSEPTHEPRMVRIREPKGEQSELGMLRAIGSKGEPAGQDAADTTPKIGISIQELDENGGVQVVSVFQGSIAERAGLKQNDVIVKINDQPASIERLMQARNGMQSGGLKLELLRGTKSMEFNLTSKRTKEQKHEKSGEALVDGEGNFWVKVGAHGDKQGNVFLGPDKQQTKGEFHFGSKEKPSGNGFQHHEAGDESSNWVISVEGDVLITDQDVAHTLPGKGGKARIQKLRSSNAPDLIFVDESGEQHRVHGQHDLSWISAEDADEDIEVQVDGEHGQNIFTWKSAEKPHGKLEFLRRDKLQDLHEHLQGASKNLMEVHGWDVEKLHEHLKDAAHELPKLKSLEKLHNLRLPQIKGLERLHELNLPSLKGLERLQELGLDKLDVDDLHEHLKQGNNFVQGFKKRFSEHGAEEGETDSNQFSFEFKSGEFPQLDGVDMKAVQEKLRAALRMNPDNESLRMALKTLKGSVMPTDGTHDSKTLRFKVLNDAGENVFVEEMEGVEIEGISDSIVNRIKNRIIKRLPSAAEAECADCAKPQSGMQQSWSQRDETSAMEAELNRMRDLLRQRQAELETLQKKLESMRRQAR